MVRGGTTEIMEGDWSGRIVVLEFDYLEAARAWYDSDDYQACRPIRLESSKGRMIAVEGAA